MCKGSQEPLEFLKDSFRRPCEATFSRAELGNSNKQLNKQTNPDNDCAVFNPNPRLRGFREMTNSCKVSQLLLDRMSIKGTVWWVD